MKLKIITKNKINNNDDNFIKIGLQQRGSYMALIYTKKLITFSKE
jgi:hypothetical protein